MTASPAKLVAMLYTKAITALRDAVTAIKTGDIERRWRSNAMAQEIIAHLHGTLDLEKGGEVARNLDQLYRFMLRRLPQVDFKNDAKAAEEIIGLLEPLARSWEELAKRGAASAPLSPKTPPGPVSVSA
jgi:flagellar protein FliS